MQSYISVARTYLGLVYMSTDKGIRQVADELSYGMYSPLGLRSRMTNMTRNMYKRLTYKLWRCYVQSMPIGQLNTVKLEYLGSCLE